MEGQPKAGTSAKPERKPGKEPYIVEKDDTVSYLGVEVPKGEGGPLVPSREESAGYFYTEEDYELRREIATSLALNKPILFEGGTGIGKTSAVAAMCAELNLNFCKVSFGREMAIEDIIGGKTIKVTDGKESVEWYDGPLLTAIRHGGIALLDEYNFQGSKIGSRVNPVIDAILNGRKEITLPENDHERITVHPGFRLVAAQNPPGTEEGQEFTGREQLSAETFGRWTFHKLPLDMSRSSREKRLAGQMGEEVDVQLPESAFRRLGEGVPTHELKDIPGMAHWRRAALDVFDQLKTNSTGANRELAKNQRQKLYFNPRLEQGLLNYVSRFYRGDVNEAWVGAFEHLVVGMYKDEADRQAVRELLRLNAYAPQADTKRKGLEDEAMKSLTPEQQREVFGDLKEMVTLENAERIMGKNMLGPNDVESVFGVRVEAPPIPFSAAELQRAKELGQRLVLYVDSMTQKTGMLSSRGKVVPLTMQNLKAKFATAGDGMPMWYEQDWYNGEDFFKNEKPRAGWKLVGAEVLPDSTSKNYLQQTDVLADYLTKEVFKGVSVPSPYQEAIAEYKKQRAYIEELMTSDWQKAAEALANLEITKLTRETSVEVMYRLVLQDRARSEKLLPSMYTWTASRVSGGGLVSVGGFGARGALVFDGRPGHAHSFIGVSFSRS